ncbi:MAG: hypothetical protein OEU26_27885 [Candidatus Tectomicrobia bacterium]|nr:hypothetical protein [Candidatus Tectomicrobia bacterium]
MTFEKDAEHIGQMRVAGVMPTGNEQALAPEYRLTQLVLHLGGQFDPFG